MLKGKFSAEAILLGIFTLVFMSTLVSAQQIEIKRPLDGATVRETVNILVPAGNIPEGGFLSCSIDGRFRCALATKTENDDSFVYRWDTKAEDPNLELPEDQRKPRDGKHTITVQSYDPSGKKFGEGKTISVYVKNNASADMPSEGLKLRYKQVIGGLTKYKFKFTLDVKSIQGATDVAASAGEAVEGTEGTIKRSIEDILPDAKMLVRQKLQGMLRIYQSGQAVPATWILPKAGYDIEDSLGQIFSVMKSVSSGDAVTIDLPNLPSERVRIGDTWSQLEKVFRNVITGESATLMATNTLEGLEWENGHPCAKIRTTFAGNARIPISSVFVEPIPVTGEIVTYFDYRIGKVISSTVHAKADASVDQNVVSSLTQSRMPQGASTGLGAPTFNSSMNSRMNSRMSSYPSQPPPSPMGAESMGAPGASASGTVSVKLEINQNITLVP